MGCGASAPMEEKTSPLDVDRTPSARLRVERSLSASVRGETAVSLEGYEFQGTLGYGAFARVLKARHIASGEDRAVKVIDKAVLRKKKTMRRSGSAIAISSALDKLEAEITLQKDFAWCGPSEAVAGDRPGQVRGASSANRRHLRVLGAGDDERSSDVQRLFLRLLGARGVLLQL